MTVNVTKNTAVSVHDASPADTVRVTKSTVNVAVGPEADSVRVIKSAAYVVVGPEIRVVNTTNVIVVT